MGDITPATPPEVVAHDQGPPHREVKVLVTGYGPFHARYPTNASWSIASTLPTYLAATPTCPRVNLIVPPEPIEVAYATVTDWVGTWLGSDDYDIVLHIGLAAGRKFFTMERQSMRVPYWEKKDVRGEVFSKEKTDQMWPVSDYPGTLKPDFDCDDVWRRWRNEVDHRLDVRPSDDPGNYLCGFIYYASMAWYWGRQSKVRPVMFLHVPDLPTEGHIENGRQVAIGLIRALVESRERKGNEGAFKVRPDGNVMGHQRLAMLSPVVESTPESDEVTHAQPNETEDDMSWTYRSG